jgi:uncharacterized protein YxjI
VSDSPPSAGSLPPPAAPSEARSRKPRRPAFILIIVLSIVVRLGRQELGALFGVAGVVIGFVLFVGIAIGWRLYIRRRAQRAGVAEHTPQMIQTQFQESGVAPPAFVEDGSLLGSSILVVNQRSKLIEVQTEYEVFDVHGHTIGHVRQIGQGRSKQVLRFIASFDQFFTHHFEITDRAGAVVLRITRPRKVFKSRVEVFDANDRFLGRIVQRNVFGKIGFGIHSPEGVELAVLQAENWRAWDFRVDLPSGIEVARLTKTWEGYARTYLTNADHYVFRVHQVLGEPLRSLVIAVALTVDVALKQDPRGLGGG